MKRFLQNNRISVTSALMLSIMAFCAFLLFDKVQILAVFEALSALVFLLFFFTYKVLKNHDLYINLVVYHLSISASLVLVKAAVKGSSFIYSVNVSRPVCIFFVVMLVLEIAFLAWAFFKQYRKKTGSEQIREFHSIQLMLVQLFDYERIRDYLKLSSVIGLNSAWGTGKTTIINYLEERESDNYYFININLLSLNVDDLKLTIIESFSDLFRRQRIFSYSSDRLITLLSKTDIFGKISSVVFKDSKTFEETLKEFKQDVTKLDKPVVIVYEDLDRIKDADKIKSVLDVSNYLLADRIKVIYQYDELRLQKISKELDFDFLGKYIPCSIELTALDLREIIEHLMSTHKNSNEWNKLISVKDFELLWRHVDVSTGVAAVFGGKVNIPSVLFPVPVYAEIRNVEQFIEEICFILKAEPVLSNKKEILIIVMYLKHFMHSYYMDLQINTSPLHTFPFADVVSNKELPLAKIIQNEKSSRDQSNHARTDNTGKAIEFLNYCYRIN